MRETLTRTPRSITVKKMLLAIRMLVNLAAASIRSRSCLAQSHKAVCQIPITWRGMNKHVGFQWHFTLLDLFAYLLKLARFFSGLYVPQSDSESFLRRRSHRSR